MSLRIIDLDQRFVRYFFIVFREICTTRLKNVGLSLKYHPLQSEKNQKIASFVYDPIGDRHVSQTPDDVTMGRNHVFPRTRIERVKSSSVDSNGYYNNIGQRIVGR